MTKTTALARQKDKMNVRSYLKSLLTGLQKVLVVNCKLFLQHILDNTHNIAGDTDHTNGGHKDVQIVAECIKRGSHVVGKTRKGDSVLKYLLLNPVVGEKRYKKTI